MRDIRRVKLEFVQCIKYNVEKPAGEKQDKRFEILGVSRLNLYNMQNNIV